MVPWEKALLVGSLLLLDFLIFMLLATLLMGYDDSYEGPPAEYGKWHTMTPFQRGVSISFTSWVWGNALALVVLLYWLVKRRARRSLSV